MVHSNGSGTPSLHTKGSSCLGPSPPKPTTMVCEMWSMALIPLPLVPLTLSQVLNLILQPPKALKVCISKTCRSTLLVPPMSPGLCGGRSGLHF